LDYKKIGPFKILAKIGTSPYKLVFPPSIAINNKFHISLLEAYQDNQFPSQIKEPPPPSQLEGDDEYELDENHQLSTSQQQAPISGLVERLLTRTR